MSHAQYPVIITAPSIAVYDNRGVQNVNDAVQFHGGFYFEDKLGWNRSDARTQVPMPRYRVGNELPMPVVKENGTITQLGRCFNCGQRHIVSKCQNRVDRGCVSFNRRNFDIYSTKSKARNLNKLNSVTSDRYYTLPSVPSRAPKMDTPKIIAEQKSEAAAAADGKPTTPIENVDPAQQPTEEEGKEKAQEQEQEEEELEQGQIEKAAVEESTAAAPAAATAATAAVEEEEEEDEAMEIGFGEVDQFIMPLQIYKSARQVEVVNVELHQTTTSSSNHRQRRPTSERQSSRHDRSRHSSNRDSSGSGDRDRRADRDRDRDNDRDRHRHRHHRRDNSRERDRHSSYGSRRYDRYDRDDRLDYGLDLSGNHNRYGGRSVDTKRIMGRVQNWFDSRGDQTRSRHTDTRLPNNSAHDNRYRPSNYGR